MKSQKHNPSAKGAPLAIYGAGGLGREITGIIHDINQITHQWNVIGFFDDGIKKNSSIDDIKILGGLKEINATGSPLNLIMAIADPATRERLVKKIINPKIKFPALIHPACLTGDKKRNQFGRGVILTAGVILTTRIVIGDFVLINLGCTVGHDVKIGNFSSVMPGVSISGSVSLGEQCMVGTGARILQNISVGDKSIIGAGAVVTKSFGKGSKLIGIPAVNGVTTK